MVRLNIYVTPFWAYFLLTTLRHIKYTLFYKMWASWLDFSVCSYFYNGIIVTAFLFYTQRYKMPTKDYIENNSIFMKYPMWCILLLLLFPTKLLSLIPLIVAKLTHVHTYSISNSEGNSFSKIMLNTLTSLTKLATRKAKKIF